MRKMVLGAVAVAGLMMPAMAAAQAAPAPAAPATGDLVEVATQAGSFSTLLKAVEAAGLVEALKGAGPFTVFAPTDAAFAKLPAGTLEALLADREQLVAVLTYHVVPGRVMAAQVLASGDLSPASLQGERLRIVVHGDKVHVDGATVIATDVEATNGVIHVIDSVVLPGKGGK